jgi:multidrug efflux pump subunit AcrA (membrane-fusion protein)
MSSESLFREEALRHAAAGHGAGDVLRLSPSWTRWTYWLLIAAFVAAVIFGIFGTVSEYGSGPAVVWVSGRIDATAKVSGTVSSIEVRPGQHVEAGDILVRLHAEREIAELARVQREFDLQLVKTLRDPSDQAARQSLTSLRTQRDLAAAQLDERLVRAPASGDVGDVRIRPGQLLAAGDIAASLTGAASRLSILVMLPAQYLPQLHPGMELRFEVTGYRYAYQEMVIESVGTQVIGPAEVRRYLGQEIADTVKLDGPVVLCEARPANSSFEVDGRSFELHHGMSGVGEVRVRTEALLVAIVPGVRALIDMVRRGAHG